MSDLISPPPVPGSSVATGASGPPLATPWARLVGAIIDGITLIPAYYIFRWIVGKIFAASATTVEEYIEAAAKGRPISDLGPGSVTLFFANVIWYVLIAAAFVAINFVFLKRGQTVGKWVMKLQILDRTNGGLVPINDLILRRVLPVLGAAAILGAIHWALSLVVLADALCIFRPQYNTLHDDLANTKVVQHPGSPIAALNPPGVPAIGPSATGA